MNKPQIQFIQFTPEEFKELISESVKNQFNALSSQSRESVKDEQKEFITRKETAKLFNVSLVTIHDWQKNGILKVYKMGNRSFFKYSELLETLYNSNRS
ncbi:MAG: helix-turn-helix domain-containing protein [Crocinitomicaceae bacterium]|nr:helix-turn-helix domain-containing protein [Crocinitomicaceae bacterium]